MTHDRDLKNRVRARMQKTGESYTAARRQLLGQRPPEAVFEFTAPPPPTPPAVIEFAAPAEVSGGARAPGRRWSPSGLFLGVVALAAIAGAAPRLFELRQRAHEQRVVADVVRRLGGAVRYDWQGRPGALATQADDWNVDPTAAGKGPRGPAWLRGLVGDEYFQEIKAVTLFASTPSEADLAALGRLESLESINLHGARLLDEGLVHLASLPRLRRLVLAMGSIDDEGLRHVGTMRNLEVLTLDRTAVSDAGIASLGRLEHLRELSLSHTRVSDAAARALQGLATLETLALDDTQVSEGAAAVVRRHLPKAKVLHPRPEDSPKC